MKLSLIVPVYNIGDYIEDCIKSILNQDLSDCEVLLIDDGSSDHSSCICIDYAKNHSQITYLRKENGGLGSARNYGLHNAKGEYVWFIDGDDEITENSVIELLSEIKKLKSEMIMFYMYNTGFKDEKMRLDYQMLYLDNYSILDFLAATKMFNVSVCVFAFRRDFLINNQLFSDESMYFQDDHLMCRVYNTASNISVLNKAFYIYKARQGSITLSPVSQKKIRSKYKMIKLLDEMTPKVLTEIKIKNKLFWHIREFIIMNAVYSNHNYLNIIFETIPKQKVFFKDPKGVILGKILYNLNKKLYCSLVLRAEKR